MIERRNELRKNSTKAETLLWDVLKNKNFNGLKFRRQHGIGPFVVDFYHAKTRTIIEIDGEIHNDPAVRRDDAARQEYLEGLGYSFLRFKNEEIFHRLADVLNVISQHTQKAESEILALEVPPLPRGRGSGRERTL